MYASIAWKRAFNRKNLLDLYKEKVCLKPSVGMDRISCEKFSQELDINIEIILRKCFNKTYKFTCYRMLLISKGPKKYPRRICIPTMRDKLVLAALNEVLNDTYDGLNKTPLPQVVVNKIINRILDYNFYIKIDIEQFYASISHEKLSKIISRRIRKKEILYLIKRALCTSAISLPIKERNHNRSIDLKGIPEGLSISNSLANIYLQNIDEKYKQILGVEYYRYVDDILILIKDNDCEKIKREIECDLKRLDLRINDKTSYGLINDGFEYLGYKFTKDNVSVREASVLKIEQSIEDIFRKFASGNIKYLEWKLNLRITGCIWNRNKYGWMFYYSQVTDEKLLFHLDNLVKKLCNRYKIKGGIKVKRFVRTYMEINKALHYTKYIPNINELDIKEKITILERIYNKRLTNKSVEDVDFLFKKIMKREIQDMERDVQNIS